jgi:hypothetical protein
MAAMAHADTSDVIDGPVPGEPSGPLSATAGLGTRNAVILDVVAVILFAVLARLAHSPLTIGTWFHACWPFAVGLAIAWGLTFTPQVHRARGTGVLIWLVTWFAGIVVWSIANTQFEIFMYIVSLIVLGVLCIGWRALASRLLPQDAALD